MGVFPKELTNLICFFPGSLNGLNVGGAVKLRGVEIGLVSEIRLQPLPFEGWPYTTDKTIPRTFGGYRYRRISVSSPWSNRSSPQVSGARNPNTAWISGPTRHGKPLTGYSMST
jgi:hypothetical protein